MGWINNIKMASSIKSLVIKTILYVKRGRAEYVIYIYIISYLFFSIEITNEKVSQS